MRSTTIATCVACVLAVSPVVAQNPIREGRWDVTMHLLMPNMPTPIPPMKTVQCITKKQLEDPGSALPGTSPNQKNQNNDCRVSDYKAVDKKVTWKMVCTGRQSMSGDGEIVVDGDTYTGIMKMTSEKGEMTMKYSAKRLGDCPE